MRIRRFNEDKKQLEGPPMKAYLVTFEPMTRVLAPDYMSEEDVIDLARPLAIRNLREDGSLDHFSEIKDDTVIPFDPTDEKDRKEQERYYDEWKKKNITRFDL